jgi:hypothetical protein
VEVRIHVTEFPRAIARNRTKAQETWIFNGRTAAATEGIVVGLPRDMVKLLHANKRVRNRMTDKDLRLRRHGSWSDSSPDSSSSYPSHPSSFSSGTSDAGDEHLSSMCSSFSSLSDSSDEDKGAEMNEFIRGDDSGCGSSTWQVYLECIDRMNRKWHHQGRRTEEQQALLIEQYQHEFEQMEASKRVRIRREM